MSNKTFVERTESIRAYGNFALVKLSPDQKLSPSDTVFLYDKVDHSNMKYKHSQTVEERNVALKDLTTAQAEIATLTAQVERLTEALKPFANFACDLPGDEECDCHNCIAKAALTPDRKGG